MAIATGAIAIMLLTVTLPLAAQQQGPGQSGRGCGQALVSRFDELDPGVLTSAEVHELNFLREEEKLARDVYLTLGDRWQLPIFFNIAGAEQRHVNSVLMVLEAYQIPDPVVDDTVGAFANPELAALYTQLVSDGEQALIDALTVGALIEDMDLADLYDLLAITSNPRVRLVAQNLAKGSRNHLRAFVAALAAQDASYTPQYLELDSYEAIVDSGLEARVVYDEDGNVIASCGRAGARGRGTRGTGSGSTSGQGAGSQGSGTCTGDGPSGSGTRGSSGSTGQGPGSGTGTQGGGQGGGPRDGSCQS
jgi:hypothetical protein